MQIATIAVPVAVARVAAPAVGMNKLLKSLAIAALATLTACGGGGGGQTQTGGTGENETPPSEAPTDITIGTPITGTIDSATDVDSFRLPITEEGTLTITTTGAGNPSIRVLDATGMEIPGQQGSYVVTITATILERGGYVTIELYGGTLGQNYMATVHFSVAPVQTPPATDEERDAQGLEVSSDGTIRIGGNVLKVTHFERTDNVWKTGNLNRRSHVTCPGTPSRNTECAYTKTRQYGTVNIPGVGEVTNDVTTDPSDWQGSTDAGFDRLRQLFANSEKDVEELGELYGMQMVHIPVQLWTQDESDRCNVSAGDLACQDIGIHNVDVKSYGGYGQWMVFHTLDMFTTADAVDGVSNIWVGDMGAAFGQLFVDAGGDSRPKEALGSAFWRGAMVGREPATVGATFPDVHGKSEIEYDFGGHTVDVRFSEIVNSRTGSPASEPSFAWTGNSSEQGCIVLYSWPRKPSRQSRPPHYQGVH